ncbi:MAG: antirestriction protein ArdA [Oscillospiraceae bacterium]|nr:antirestriction protein ArdA [Oscillospiraceae bacterium]
MLEAFVTNLGRYNEGYLDGEYLKLPATTEEVQALLKRIYVDGVRYEEILITDYITDIPGLRSCMGENESIDELNYLAALLDDLEEWEVEKFAAAVDFGEYNSVSALINLTQNLDCFEFYAGIENEEDLGRFYIEEMCTLEIPEHLESYIDYEAYGRDMNLDEDGRFTEGGYVVRTGDSFTEHYSDRSDIADEYRIFAYPEPEKSIKKTLESYGKMKSETVTASHGRPHQDNVER